MVLYFVWIYQLDFLSYEATRSGLTCWFGFSSGAALPGASACGLPGPFDDLVESGGRQRIKPISARFFYPRSRPTTTPSDPEPLAPKRFSSC